MAEPTGYSDAVGRAAVFRIEDAGLFRTVGPDAQDYLHRMLSNDIRSLVPGRGAHACYLDINGRLLADLWAWVLDAETILVETEDARTDALMAGLERYIIMERVELEDARGGLQLISVQGPDAVASVAVAAEAELGPLAAGEALQSGEGAGWVMACARRRTALPGVDVYASPERMRSILAGLHRAGVPEGSAEALNTLRIEAGIPAWGAELDEDTIPLEANLEGVAISFSKGCYPGQEIIARIRSRGEPARHLMGIQLHGPAAPGALVTVDGHAAGVVTSAAVSPRLGPIAMAYLKKGLGEPGLAVRAGDAAGRTVELPF